MRFLQHTSNFGQNFTKYASGVGDPFGRHMAIWMFHLFCVCRETLILSSYVSMWAVYQIEEIYQNGCYLTTIGQNDKIFEGVYKKI